MMPTSPRSPYHSVRRGFPTSAGRPAPKKLGRIIGPAAQTRACVRDRSCSEFEEDRREAGAGKFEMSKPLLSFLVFIALTFATACDRGRERTNVVTGDGQPEVTVMDFSAPFSLDPLPAGWYHRTFWTRGPMQTAFAVKDGVPALRFETGRLPRCCSVTSIWTWPIISS